MVTLDFMSLTDYAGELLSGTVSTMWLSAVIYVLTLSISIPLAFVRSNTRVKALSWLLTIYVEIVRNVPALVFIFMAYFGLPKAGIRVNSTILGIVVSVLVLTGYTTENVRGGINAVSSGQWEAIDALGIPRFTGIVKIILPQTLKNCWPALTNMLVITIFSTSVLSVIDVRELTQITGLINAESFRTLEVYIVAVAIYYIITTLFRLAFAGVYRLAFSKETR
ncbi:amino acid ABC transporter permease [Bifidobacterium psychraerophilum]|uniref:amino acid ABC transporter permease n=1 Tax=Bifidobacterium psychraerophilum TaxID=218140 RepID=UPI0039EA80F1